MIVDKSLEYYPDLIGARYLKFVSDKIPEGVTIYCSNVCTNGRNEAVISRFSYEHWGWAAPEGFDCQYDTPEEALDAYLKHKQRT